MVAATKNSFAACPPPFETTARPASATATGEKSGALSWERWQEENQAYLGSMTEYIKSILVSRLDLSPDEPADAAEPGEPAEFAASSLSQLCHTLRLSSFERDLLLLCAGVELDGELAGIFAEALGEATRTLPTFGLALACLPNAHWSAITPVAPLRHFGLIDFPADGVPLTAAPLRVDEWVLHFLTGTAYPDNRLPGIHSLSAPPSDFLLAQTNRRAADHIADVWSAAWQNQSVPLLAQLCGEGGDEKIAVARAVCARLGAHLRIIPLDVLPTERQEQKRFLHGQWREAALLNTIVLINAENGITNAEAVGLPFSLIERLNGPVFLAHPGRLQVSQPSLIVETEMASPEEQWWLWRSLLAEARTEKFPPPLTAREIQTLAVQFSLTGSALKTVCQEVAATFDSEQTEQTDDQTGLQRYWSVCRTQARPNLDSLAQRVTCSATWDDLILPDTQKAVIGALLAQARRRGTVYLEWGVSGRGLGVTALFAGEPGTGKTLCAEIIARELDLDLYRVDLSTVVSKYIGETEKNLRQIFAAAEAGGAILLFDEADALFGKRSEVKDSHDRHANIEVAYLLQRMENYRGVALLTTNQKKSLDEAFLRRLRYVVEFPFPGHAERATIWQRAIPTSVPVSPGIAPETLAQLNLAGGGIRSVVLNALFLAADSETPLDMQHLLRAAQTEYAKRGKAIPAAELHGWPDRLAGSPLQTGREVPAASAATIPTISAGKSKKINENH